MGLSKGCKPNNTHGRPPAGKAFVEQLRDAITKVAKKKGRTLMEHAVERAYVDDMVLVALMKKLLPDLSETENTGKLRFDHFVQQINTYQKGDDGKDTV
jgi:hypothetical protein